MKCKVKVNAINLKRNKVARLGEIIDSGQLPNPENVDQLIKDGYLAKAKLSKAEANKKAEAEKKAEADKKAEKRKLLEEQLKNLDESGIKKYAIENGIDVTSKAKKNKLIAEVLTDFDK